MPSLKSEVHSPPGPCCQRSICRDITMFFRPPSREDTAFLLSHFEFLSSDIAKSFRARGCVPSANDVIALFPLDGEC